MPGNAHTASLCDVASLPLCSSDADSSVFVAFVSDAVPTGFMPSGAWQVVTDFYKNKDDPDRQWIQYATPQVPAS